MFKQYVKIEQVWIIFSVARGGGGGIEGVVRQTDRYFIDRKKVIKRYMS